MNTEVPRNMQGLGLKGFGDSQKRSIVKIVSSLGLRGTRMI